MIDDEVLHLFAGTDEVEHRHALRQCDKKGCEEPEKDMSLQIYRLRHREAKIDGNAEANDGQ